MDQIWIKFGKRVIRHSIYILFEYSMNLKNVALQLCTCTWIEITTAAGITLYLLYLHSYQLALITIAVFAPLIGFHFAITKLSKTEDCGIVRCRLKYSHSSNIDNVKVASK